MDKKGYMIVSTEDVNRDGFRIISNGGDFTRFRKNPVMLYVHERKADGKAKLPIGRWEDLQVTPEGHIIGKPVFNEKDPDGAAAKQAFEDGFLHACSINVDPHEWSDDPSMILPGQLLPTVTKWELLEISMADLPVNAGCVRVNHLGKTIGLSASNPNRASELQELFNIKPNFSMKSIIALLNNTKALGLSLGETATESEVLSGISKALQQGADALAAKETALTAKDLQIQQLTSERDVLKTEKQLALESAKDEKALVLVEGAISSKKIVAGQKDQYLKLAKGDYETTKSILDGMKGYESVNAKLKDADQSEVEADAKKYDDLFKSNKLLALKEKSFDEYSKLFEAKFGKKPSK